MSDRTRWRSLPRPIGRRYPTLTRGHPLFNMRYQEERSRVHTPRIAVRAIGVSERPTILRRMRPVCVRLHRAPWPRLIDGEGLPPELFRSPERDLPNLLESVLSLVEAVEEYNDGDTLN